MSELARLVVGQGVRLGVGGALLGVVLSVAFGRFLMPLLFRESPYDPAVIGVALAALAASTLVACAVPAIRAGRSDPSIALRAD